MTVLLDTHAFLWFIFGDDRISPLARTTLESAENWKILSVASLWEIAIKVSIGKLAIRGSFDEVILPELDRPDIRVLPIQVPHVSYVARLALRHRDPFDRILAAQAAVEGLPIISADVAFDGYGITRMW